MPPTAAAMIILSAAGTTDNAGGAPGEGEPTAYRRCWPSSSLRELHDRGCLPTRCRFRDIEHRCGVGRARRAGPAVAVRRFTPAALGGVRRDRDRAAVRLGRAAGWVQPEPGRFG